MTARATTTVHPNMHVSTTERNSAPGGAGAGEVDPFAVILKAVRQRLAAHHWPRTHVTPDQRSSEGQSTDYKQGS